MNLTGFLQGWRYSEIALVLVLAFVSIMLWRVPIIGWLFYPFHLFGTFVHELSHGFAAIFTGGDFQRFEVNLDRSGTAWYTGGIRWIVTSAGYLGCALFGGLLIILSASGFSGRTVLTIVGVALGILCLIWVRNLFGIASGLIIATLLVIAGNRLTVGLADALLLFLAVQVVLNALNSVFDLILISTRQHNIVTDAQIMQSITGIPAPFWAIIWTVIAIAILIGALVLAYRDSALPLTT